MAALSVPIFAIVIGEGGSGGALGIAVANKVLILENAYYSLSLQKAVLQYYGKTELLLQMQLKL